MKIYQIIIKLEHMGVIKIELVKVMIKKLHFDPYSLRRIDTR